MAHKLRPGDRVKLLVPGWGVAHAPKARDVGTYLGGHYGPRVLYDRAETHTPVDPPGFTYAFVNGRQTWGTDERYYRYIGKRVNPEKL